MQEYLKNLTPEQLEAATEINGPMMVIAGPGTGKTQVMSARIAYILENTDIKPENILVLTFTDSGTIAVRKRLHKFIGNAAYYVPIYTFHAFAESIIETYKDYFGGLGSSILTDIDQITLIHSILDESKLDRLKIVDDSYYYTRDILKNISILKKEAVTYEKLKVLAQEEIDFLQNDPSSLNKRTKKLKVDIEAKIKSLEKSFELAIVYEKYQEGLKKKKTHDYDDMIISVLDKIINEPELKSDLQEKYQYFLVDEYQDTNSAQNKIVEQLAINMYGDDPDIFVVGDDDQSIYRFQGASLSNILYFRKKFENSKIVMMTRSFRSTQKILDASMSVIKNNEERLTNKIQGISKNLFSDIQSKNTSIGIYDFDTSRFEYVWVAEEIKKLVKDGYKYSDIAIFFRNNSEIMDIASILSAHKIPLTSDKMSNILDDSDIRNLITLIRCIAEPYDDRLFYNVMCQEWTNIDAVDIVKLAEHRHKARCSFFDLTLNEEELNKLNIGQNKDKKEITNGLFSDSLEKAESDNNVLKLSTFLAQQNKILNTESFVIFFDRLLKDIKFADRIMAKENRMAKLNRLSTLFDEIKAQTLNNIDYSYRDFINYINIISDYNLSISEKTLNINSDSVKIMTAHKSKGLEFKVVFIPKCVDKYWGNSQNRQNISLPDNIVGDMKQTKEEKNEEERRLFYVALTRAMEKIYISYAGQYENSYGTKNTMQSMFISEIDNNLIEIVHPDISISEQDILNELNITNVIANEDKNKLLPEEKEHINKLVEDLKLNATALNNYLECPKKFYYNNLLHIPQLRSDKQSFGTAMHKALEIFYDEFKDNNILPSKDFLINAYNEIFINEWTTSEAKEKLTNLGVKGLSGYYDNVIIPQNEIYNIQYTELNFEKRNVYFDDIRITGKIDTIITDKNSNNKTGIVVDYKTGKIKSKYEIEKFTKNTEGELIPSKFYSQLMFYKILTDNDQSFKYEITHGMLDFIEGKDGKYRQEIIEYKQSDVDNFKVIIKDTVSKIRNLEFDTIKKSRTCDNCPYSKICWGC
ncbi:MAG: ATP-dependent DNA helicase [bacterium]